MQVRRGRKCRAPATADRVEGRTIALRLLHVDTAAIVVRDCHVAVLLSHDPASQNVSWKSLQIGSRADPVIVLLGWLKAHPGGV